jgi:ketosteroid isomerase-like protein
MPVPDLGQQWAAAERTADTQALSRLLTDDFVAVGPAGFVLDKEQWLARYDSGDLRHDAFSWTPETVRDHGPSTAIVVGVQEQSSRHQGRDVSGRFRVTQVLVGHGRIAALHLSTIRG